MRHNCATTYLYALLRRIEKKKKKLRISLYCVCSGLGKSLATGTSSGAKSLDLMRSFRIRMGQHADLLVDRVQGHEGGRLNILLNTTSNPIPDSPGLKRRRKQISKDFRTRRGV